MATRSRRGEVLEDRVKPLLNTAIEYLTRHSGGMFRKVYFLTYTDKEFEVCREILGTDSRLKPVYLSQRAPENPVAETQVTDSGASGQTADLGSHGEASTPEGVGPGVEANAADDSTPNSRKRQKAR